MSTAETNADLLRRAAALMRERAEEATPGPWSNRRHLDEQVVRTDTGAPLARTDTRADRRHIASWHPVVALAVADLMDDGATFIEYVAMNHSAEASGTEGQFFLAVARTYLGEQ